MHEIDVFSDLKQDTRDTLEREDRCRSEYNYTLKQRYIDPTICLRWGPLLLEVIINVFFLYEASQFAYNPQIVSTMCVNFVRYHQNLCTCTKLI